MACRVTEDHFVLLVSESEGEVCVLGSHVFLPAVPVQIVLQSCVSKKRFNTSVGQRMKLSDMCG
jgi:hypothetical protein